jgi:hypothetical protein
VLLAPALGRALPGPPTLSFCPHEGRELRRVAIQTPCAAAYPPRG